MRETWLMPNRRALWFGCIPPLALGLLGIWMFVQDGSFWQAWRWSGLVAMGVGGVLLGMLLRQLLRPRIAYCDGHVLFYLRSGAPLAVPASIVEAFFLGQGQAHLPAGVGDRERTVNLVARLSQRETEWAQRAVKPALGEWRDGYVTIRGTWSEPLGPEVIRRINRRLKEVKTLANRGD